MQTEIQVKREEDLITESKREKFWRIAAQRELEKKLEEISKRLDEKMKNIREEDENNF